VQQLGQPPDVHNVGSVAEGVEMIRECVRARLVRACGEADQEMPVRLADVAGIHRARGFDPRNRRKQAFQGRLDKVHLAAARRRAGARDDCAAVGDEGGVLDEAAVRVPGIRRQDRERKSAVIERLAVALVLQGRPLRIRRAFARLGQSLGKIVAGQAKQGVREHAGNSLGVVALQNDASEFSFAA
jgi:hypothetical protein